MITSKYRKNIWQNPVSFHDKSTQQISTEVNFFTS